MSTDDTGLVTPKTKDHQYFISFVGEAVLNPKYLGYVGGRVEVHGPDDTDGYPGEEIRYFTKKLQEFEQFRDQYDFEYYTKAELDQLRTTIETEYQDPV